MGTLRNGWGQIFTLESREVGTIAVAEGKGHGA
jgi:hypothetical protein